MLDAYLARIGWDGAAPGPDRAISVPRADRAMSVPRADRAMSVPRADRAMSVPRADRATLDRILALQAASIPFEGIAALLGETPSLAPDALHPKLLGGKRGGWCFEQNALLAGALEAIGFDVTRHMARVTMGAPADVITQRHHLVLQVALPEGPLLADAGFGLATPTAALPLGPGAEGATPHERFRWQQRAHGLMLQVAAGDAWQDCYLLALERVHEPDLDDANWLVANRPGGLFTANLVCALSPPGERRRLLNRRLTVTRTDGSETVARLETPAALREGLAEAFGLHVSAEEAAALDAAIAAERPGFIPA
jgi:N-hydroxyarylamine O-acetyltransferase